MIPVVNDILLIDPIVGKVAKGSLLDLQLKEFGKKHSSYCLVAVPGCSSNSLSTVSSFESEHPSSYVVDRSENLGHHKASVIQIISPVKEHPVLSMK